MTSRANLPGIFEDLRMASAFPKSLVPAFNSVPVAEFVTNGILNFRSQLPLLPGRRKTTGGRERRDSPNECSSTSLSMLLSSFKVSLKSLLESVRHHCPSCVGNGLASQASSGTKDGSDRPRMSEESLLVFLLARQVSQLGTRTPEDVP